MKWKLSPFGQAFGAQSGINELMRDLGAAMSPGSSFSMLGGGNPAHIPSVEAIWKERWRELSNNEAELYDILGNYDPPNGNIPFLEALSTSLSERYGWPITSSNIAVVNGSQNAFFYLLNMFAPPDAHDHEAAKIFLPLVPEYIGYADQLVPPRSFIAQPPRVEYIGEHRFKYHIDFDHLTIPGDVAAMCVSRPTNPTGNVITETELDQLEDLAARHRIPLIIDNAYGAPFPDIIFTKTKMRWSEHFIWVMSLSKLGLPGARTGIIIGPPEIISAISATNAVIGLSSGSIGQGLVTPLITDGRIYEISERTVRPFYETKSQKAMEWLDSALSDTLPYRIHLSEGAFFLWIWFENLPISSYDLYERLKQRGVLIIPGHYFFYGNCSTHPHSQQCIRLSYAQPDEVVQRGVQILGEEIKSLRT